MLAVIMFGVIVVHSLSTAHSGISNTENGRAPWLTCLRSTASLPSHTFSWLRLVALFGLWLVKSSTFMETLVGTQALVQTRVFWPRVKPSHILQIRVSVTVRDLPIYVFKTNIVVSEFSFEKKRFCSRENFAAPLIHFLYMVLKTGTRRRRGNK